MSSMATNRDIYNEIAQSWYGYRHHTRFAAELEELACRWKTGRLLNVGCAHGPDFLPFREGFDLWGVDFSVEMLRLGLKYQAKFDFQATLTTADACRLPFPDDCFDHAISIATYHHIPGAEQRRQALTELHRVLKPGAEVFLTVWNRRQPAFWNKKRETGMAWRSRGTTLYRYYYLFSYREFEGLLEKAGFSVLRSAPERRYRFPFKYFSRNICVLARAR